jgi:hypothetical protein
MKRTNTNQLGHQDYAQSTLQLPLKACANAKENASQCLGKI